MAIPRISVGAKQRYDTHHSRGEELRSPDAGDHRQRQGCQPGPKDSTRSSGSGRAVAASTVRSKPDGHVAVRGVEVLGLKRVVVVTEAAEEMVVDRKHLRVLHRTHDPQDRGL